MTLVQKGLAYGLTLVTPVFQAIWFLIRELGSLALVMLVTLALGYAGVWLSRSTRAHFEEWNKSLRNYLRARQLVEYSEEYGAGEKKLPCSLRRDKKPFGTPPTHKEKEKQLDKIQTIAARDPFPPMPSPHLGQEALVTYMEELAPEIAVRQLAFEVVGRLLIRAASDPSARRVVQQAVKETADEDLVSLFDRLITKIYPLSDFYDDTVKHYHSPPRANNVTAATQSVQKLRQRYSDEARRRKREMTDSVDSVKRALLASFPVAIERQILELGQDIADWDISELIKKARYFEHIRVKFTPSLPVHAIDNTPDHWWDNGEPFFMDELEEGEVPLNGAEQRMAEASAMTDLRYERRRARMRANQCVACGETGHWKRDCQHKDARCGRCAELGHVSAVCPAGVLKTKDGSETVGLIWANQRGIRISCPRRDTRVAQLKRVSEFLGRLHELETDQAEKKNVAAREKYGRDKRAENPAWVPRPPVAHPVLALDYQGEIQDETKGTSLGEDIPADFE